MVSTLVSEDFLFRGTPFELPGGARELRGGGQHTHEHLSRLTGRRRASP